jgi:hypothetical protein
MKMQNKSTTYFINLLKINSTPAWTKKIPAWKRLGGKGYRFLAGIYLMGIFFSVVKLT